MIDFGPQEYVKYLLFVAEFQQIDGGEKSTIQLNLQF